MKSLHHAPPSTDLKRPLSHVESSGTAVTNLAGSMWMTSEDANTTTPVTGASSWATMSVTQVRASLYHVW